MFVQISVTASATSEVPPAETAEAPHQCSKAGTVDKIDLLEVENESVTILIQQSVKLFRWVVGR